MPLVGDLKSSKDSVLNPPRFPWIENLLARQLRQKHKLFERNSPIQGKVNKTRCAVYNYYNCQKKRSITVIDCMNIDRYVIDYPAIITYSKCVPDINNFNKCAMTISRDLGSGGDRPRTHTLPLSSPVRPALVCNTWPLHASALSPLSPDAVTLINSFRRTPLDFTI